METVKADTLGALGTAPFYQDDDSAIERVMTEINPAPWCNREELRKSLLAFLDDNSGKSPEALAKIANGLYDGGSLHNRGYIVQCVRAGLSLPCPWLTTAAIYNTWKGGKAGFQFLPDPAQTDALEYDEEVSELLSVFYDWANEIWTPHNVLIGNDRKFFDALPDRFAVYRGGAGLPHERLAAGVCWSTSRDVAEWFAMRSASFCGGEPVVVSAQIPKSAVCLAFNSECEVVVSSLRWRAVKCRMRKGRGQSRPWRPKMEWCAA